MTEEKEGCSPTLDTVDKILDFMGKEEPKTKNQIQKATQVDWDSMKTALDWLIDKEMVEKAEKSKHNTVHYRLK